MGTTEIPKMIGAGTKIRRLEPPAPRTSGASNLRRLEPPALTLSEAGWDEPRGEPGTAQTNPAMHPL